MRATLKVVEVCSQELERTTAPVKKNKASFEERRAVGHLIN